MKKKFNYTVLVMFGLLLAIITVYVVYYRYYYPNENTYNAYLNVFEEFDSSISTVKISSINHRVEIKESNNDKVKIAYYQKLENSNKYTTSSTMLSLIIQEEVEDVNNLFFKAENKIDVITVYLPSKKNINVNIESVYGGITINEVQINNLTFNNINGDINIEDSEFKILDLQTNSGKINISKSNFEELKINSTSGLMNIDLADDLAYYDCDIYTEFGAITFNDEIYKVSDEDGNENTGKKYYTDTTYATKYIDIATIRSNINIEYQLENKTINQED